MADVESELTERVAAITLLPSITLGDIKKAQLQDGDMLK